MPTGRWCRGVLQFRCRRAAATAKTGPPPGLLRAWAAAHVDEPFRRPDSIAQGAPQPSTAPGSRSATGAGHCYTLLHCRCRSSLSRKDFKINNYTRTSACRGGRLFGGCPVVSGRFSEPGQGQLRACARRSGRVDRRNDGGVLGDRPLPGSGLVLLGNARGDAPAVADRDAVGFRPGPDVGAALAS